MKMNAPTRFGIAAVAGLALGMAGSAAAGTTNYLVSGQLGIDQPSDGIARGLDNSTFELRLAFEEDAQPDPDRSTFATPTLTYVADAWSLAYFRGDAVVAEYDSDTNPDALGFAEFNGRLTGFDSSGETFIVVGVEAGPVSDGEPLFGSLIATEFITPTLVDAFFTNDLADIPGDFDSSGGSALDESREFYLEVLDAQLAAVSIPDGVIVDSSNDNNGPEAIPTPTAAAGGAVLLLGLMIRRRRVAEAGE
ncbi:MAG: hypothetical protein AAF911_14870 [Planctomycetota bacterium]